jgi:hypothetical protein
MIYNSCDFFMKGNRYHPTRKVNPYRKGVDYNYMKSA